MRFALMTEPQQGLTYDELLAIVRTAEDVGFESFFRSDHITSFPGEGGLPATDAWATLAGLARETSRLSLGTLVSPVTFRLPGNLAKVVTTVDEMSGGRAELGLGAGWNEEEHRQHGIPFPDLPERYDMLEEQLAIVHGLWTEPDGWTFEGRHWQVAHSMFRPRPVGRFGRRHPNIIVGGEGRSRGLALAARFADEYNISSAAPEKAARVVESLRQACGTAGRDPDQLVVSAMTGVLIAESETDLSDRVQAQIEMMGGDREETEAWLAERRTRWVMGTPDEAMDKVAALEATGVSRIMLQDFLPRDLDMVRLMGSRLLNA
ncbi:MAG: LLM class F420-dependent oxidoreductase [Chloroflexi bacterium]|nr:LLM class F420-dependent oxidoreductase [Chloroflexota bacterium]